MFRTLSPGQASGGGAEGKERTLGTGTGRAGGGLCPGQPPISPRGPTPASELPSAEPRGKSARPWDGPPGSRALGAAAAARGRGESAQEALGLPCCVDRPSQPRPSPHHPTAEHRGQRERAGGRSPAPLTRSLLSTQPPTPQPNAWPSGLLVLTDAQGHSGLTGHLGNRMAEASIWLRALPRAHAFRALVQPAPQQGAQEHR